jgi:uncharacterized protein with gpF-like domain
MYAMAMSGERRAAFARQARARFDRHEQQLHAAMRNTIDAYLGGVRARLTISSLTAAADPAPLNASALQRLIGLIDHSSAWPELLDNNFMGTYSNVLDEVLQTGLGDPRISANLQQWRASWLADRTQALAKVPDAITSQLRTRLSILARRDGTNVYDAMQAAQKMLESGYPSWNGRAQLIARTETVGANNQGALASWKSLATATGQVATKTWLATEDSKTRKDHQRVDGTTVGIDDHFEVHGKKMNGPGDSSGGPAEVCNCRCTLTYDFPDAPATATPARERQAPLDFTKRRPTTPAAVQKVAEQQATKFEQVAKATNTDRPALTADQYAALTPGHRRNAASISSSFAKTKQGKSVFDTIKQFTERRGGVNNMRKTMARVLEGDPTLSKATADKVNSLLGAINNYPLEQVPDLYRGLGIKVDTSQPRWWAQFDEQFAVGQPMDLNISSFTSSAKKAEGFIYSPGGTTLRSGDFIGVKLTVQGKMRALPVETVSKFKSEKEWIGGGRYRITHMSKPTKAKPYYDVHIEQLESLGAS